jgi:hypothetical protein
LPSFVFLLLLPACLGACCSCSQVAVEVDGPDHFTRNTPHQLLGSSTAKHRCLQARQWAVLSVPFHEWNAITAHFTPRVTAVQGGTSQQQQQQAMAVPVSTIASGVVPTAAAAAVGDSGRVARVAAKAAEAVGVPAELALQLAAARAEYLSAALDRAVAAADYPRF